MGTVIGEYDLMRGVIVSLASLLFGVILFGTVTAYRQRYLPVPPKRAPFWAVGSFSFGYLLLLAHLVVERWAAIGQPITMMTHLSLVALVVNIAAVGIMVRFSRSPELTPWDMRWFLRRLMWLDTKHWMQSHPSNHPPPMTRHLDALVDLPDDELEREIQAATKEMGE